MCDTWQGLRVRGCGVCVDRAADRSGSESQLLAEVRWDTASETVRVR
jgi:hypothetical protein